MIDAIVVPLPHRAVIGLTGPDWAPFLKGLCTAHIDTLAEQVKAGQFRQLHYGAFLRPQGKMICDVLLHAVSGDEIRLDVPLSARDELVAKLNMYKLRAKVTIATIDTAVSVVIGDNQPEKAMADPRKSIIDYSFGFAYGALPATGTIADWNAFRFAHGLSDPGRDFGPDDLYPIDANLDLLAAIDFHKGCYVGQELTSRMKRRGQIKNRILPFRYDGDMAPAPDGEVLNGERRAGAVLAAENGRGLALMRIDRRAGQLSVDGINLLLDIPAWIAGQLPETDTEGV